MTIIDHHPLDSVTDHPPVFVEERIYLPSGMGFNDPRRAQFQVMVTYLGDNEYAITRSRNGYYRLSREGEWLFAPLPAVEEHLCRFPFVAACRLAEQFRDSVTLGGKTWLDLMLASLR